MPARIIVILIFLCCVVSKVQAQSWELGVTMGGAGYLGDLNQRNPLKVSGLATGAFLKRNFNGYFSAKASYMHAQIEGADSTSKYEQFRNRNLSFATPLNEVALTGEFNFLEYIPSISKNLFTPFIYAGVGAVKYNPQATYQGVVYDLRPLTTEGQSKPYRQTAVTLPFGVGIKYNVAGRLNLIADLGYRSARTDYIDDVSGLYADKSVFSNPVAAALSDRSGERLGYNIGAAGSQRGDLRKHDTYWFLGFTISYTFITEKCYYEK
ncbi:outer membrane beta-barrel protein [Mucilaginibacter robiniae]|uniref:Outer membrane beta-barrel protein n=1 Tax=Mucilaginibacter robiniae TaxID=2728022 RepID=A0A7L5DX52_9SPHI|nr:DUF6089 family protein [Mucilaginibacter robiniae]QJD94677.1 outer membrane beta-barrel protein [Mucilaginibacter robiniae]